MKILVLNRNSLVEREYARWIGPGHQVVLITDATALPADESLRAQILAAYDHVEVLTDFHANAAVELLACRLHERYRFDLLIGLNEYEIVRSVLPGTPSAVFGYASVPPRPAVVAGIPDSCPVEGIVDYHRHAEVGDVLGSAKLSVDKIATFIARGADRPEVLKRLEQAVEWFDNHTQLEPLSG